MSTNLAAVIVGFGEDPEIQELTFPRMAPGSVIVRIDAATLCGTDVSRWKGKLPQGGADQPFLQPLDVPYIPGHETCGTIVEIAGEAYDIQHERLKVGDRIISSYGHCGHCYYCRVARQTSFCNEVQTFGHSSPDKMIGGCAQYQYYPAEGSYIRAPEGLAPAIVASGTCALRTVMHAIELVGRIESHETVLILGAGPLGLYSLAVAREQGALRTLLIGAPQNRLAVARRWEADEVLDLDAVPDTSDRISWVRNLTDGRGADVVINCGSAYALVEGLRMTRPGGRFVQVAGGAGKPIEVPPELLFRGVRTFFPVTAEARHFYQAMRFLDLKRDRYSFSDMISNAYTLEQTGSALAGMANYTEVKPVIYPNGLPLA